MRDRILVTEIYKSILKRNGINTTYHENYRGLRDKFNYLMNEILFRDKYDFGTQRKTYVSKKEAPFVEELLYRATSGSEEDKLIIDWFNGNINSNDYEKAYQLGKKLEVIITEVYENDESWETDEVTAKEWIAALQSSIHFDTALSVLKIRSAIISLEIASSGISHNIPFNDVIFKNDKSDRVSIYSNPSPIFDVSSAPITEVFKYCLSREDYLDTILNIIELMIEDASSKTIGFIKAYAEIKNKTGATCIGDLLEKDYMASEYLGFFNEIYTYLYYHPDKLNEIEMECNSSDLLSFFKVSGLNAGRKKRTHKPE